MIEKLDPVPIQFPNNLVSRLSEMAIALNSLTNAANHLTIALRAQNFKGVGTDDHLTSLERAVSVAYHVVSTSSIKLASPQ